MAAALLPTIPAWPGTKRSAFHLGMATTSLAGLLTMVLVTSGVPRAVYTVWAKSPRS